MCVSRLRWVAAMTRTSHCMVWVPPTRSKVRSCSTRSSLTCIAIGMSPISSSSSVPPSAISKRPLRWVSAPVNAPFSWPNSSLSSRSAGIAPQLIATNGLPARLERWWMARAATSLPVPDSPRISTVVSNGATWSSICVSLRTAGLRPVGPLSPSAVVRRSSSSMRLRLARRRASCSWVRRIG